MAETQSKTEGDFVQVADHIRELNERIIGSSKHLRFIDRARRSPPAPVDR